MDSGLAGILTGALRRADPGRPAIVEAGQATTYADLDSRSAALAGRLASGSAGRSEPVAVALPRGAAALTAMVACVRAGRPFFPVDPAVDAASACRDAAVETLVCDGTAPVWWHGATVPADATGPHAPPARVDDPDCGYLLTTSGTTGAAKTVRGSGPALARYLAWQRDHLALTADDVVANTADPWFDFSFKETLGALVAGATVAVVEPAALATGGALLRRFADLRPTVLCLLPSRLAMLVEALARPGAPRLDRLRLLLVSGEPFPVALLERWRAVAPEPTVLNLYGPTESTVIKLCHTVGSSVDTDAVTVPVGRPIPGAAVELLPTVDGAATELCLVSDDLALGYLRAAGGTTVFDHDTAGRRRLRTGDLARRTRDGLIEIVGRVDHMVKRRGVKVSLPDVAAAALRHPGVVTAVAVCGAAERIVLFYTTAAPVDPRALRTVLLDRLAPEQLPDRVREVDRMPVDARGKVDRAALAALVDGPVRT
jgi:non-ribosomal peptide synthetase component F